MPWCADCWSWGVVGLPLQENRGKRIQACGETRGSVIIPIDGAPYDVLDGMVKCRCRDEDGDGLHIISSCHTVRGQADPKEHPADNNNSATAPKHPAPAGPPLALAALAAAAAGLAQAANSTTLSHPTASPLRATSATAAVKRATGSKTAP